MDYYLLAFTWLFLSFIVAWYSKNKTLGFWGGFLASVLLSPAVGLIIALSSKDCLSIFCLRFGKRMKEVKQEIYRGNREGALEKLMVIARRLQRIIRHSDNPEYYDLYLQRVSDKIAELGGEVPDTLK